MTDGSLNTALAILDHNSGTKKTDVQAKDGK